LNAFSEQPISCNKPPLDTPGQGARLPRRNIPWNRATRDTGSLQMRELGEHRRKRKQRPEPAPVQDDESLRNASDGISSQYRLPRNVMEPTWCRRKKVFFNALKGHNADASAWSRAAGSSAHLEPARPERGDVPVHVANG
jgi:hypothetical protein